MINMGKKGLITRWGCGLVLLIMGALVAAVAWIGWHIYEADNANFAFRMGAEAQQCISCAKLVRLPEQRSDEYPIVHESGGMFDFSSTVIFEASTTWIGDFIREYGLTPTDSSLAQRQIECNFQALKLDSLAAMVGSESWHHYTGGRVSYTAPDGRLCRGCFEACINAPRDKVLLHYHSFSTVKE